MINLRARFVLMLLGLFVLAACSSEPSKSTEQKPQPKPPEIVAGRTAFQRLYVAAHGWARDAQPYRLENQVTKEANGRDGKSAVWRAFFASAVQRGVKPYVWSGVEAPDAPSRGISPGTEDTYNPSNSTTQIFDIAFLKIDSDKALDTAKKRGGDKVLDKNPDLPVFFILDWSHNTNELIWHVIFGESADNPKLKVAVNASSGDFIRVEK